VQVIHNGVDIDCVKAAVDRPSPIVRESSETILLGSIGRLVPEKDHRTLLGAVSRVAEEIPDVRLVVVGDGPLRDFVEDDVRELGLSGRVEMVGELSKATVYSILHNLDVVIVSSKSEGFCNVAVEAMAAGRVIVTTSAGALPEVVADTGILVSPGSAWELAAAIMNAIRLPDYRRRTLSSLAQKRAVSNFSLEANVAAHAELYNCHAKSSRSV
jgi:glycosyltransferase involved in cell wall biosynthesis